MSHKKDLIMQFLKERIVDSSKLLTLYGIIVSFVSLLRLLFPLLLRYNTDRGMF